MRVTQSMLTNNMLRNLTNSSAQMNKYMEQLYTGKKITKPSDDPVVAMKGIGYRSELVRVEQYQRNTSEVHNWMDNSDSTLDHATSAMQRLRELAVTASNGTNSDDELQSIIQETNELKEHLVDIANTNVNGKYIFNGTNTDTPPVIVDENGNIVSQLFEGDDVLIEVSAGIKLKSDVDGEDVFGGDPGIFKAVDNFIERLDNGENIDQSIEELDAGINQIINSRADLGARMNRLELIENRLSEQEVVATRTMSDNEDVDFSEAIMNLITQESLHRAALSAGSRIIQPSLVDFLR